MAKAGNINLEGLFNGANLSGAQIIAVNEGEVFYNKYGSEATTRTRTEEDVRNAVTQLMEARDEQGRYIMFERQQWHAVRMVLTAQCGFPTNAADFDRAIRNLGLAELRIPCVYESYRKIHLAQLPNNVELWHQSRNTAGETSLKQIAVAEKLMELLAEGRQ